LKPGFIVIGALGVVVERPAATSTVHQVPELVFLVSPEPLDPASVARRAPLVGKQVTIVVERRCKLISALSTAFGELMVARMGMIVSSPSS
jgi:hypothetical protein